MLNRLPQVTTLMPQRQDLVITTGGTVYTADMRQHPFLLRALYFVLVGWWLSALWIGLAWALCASIIGLLPGFWFLNRPPAIVSLVRLLIGPRALNECGGSSLLLPPHCYSCCWARV
jgi:hypothetical protein